MTYINFLQKNLFLASLHGRPKIKNAKFGFSVYENGLIREKNAKNRVKIGLCQ